MVGNIHKRTKGPLAEGQIHPSEAKGANETLPVARSKFSFCAKCLTFFTRYLAHIKWFGVGLLCVFCGFRPVHPLYISVTEINHNPKDKILEISCKLFTNDFEAALEKMSGARVDLSAAGQKAASDKLIEAYVERHLRLRVDGRPVALHFVGSEKENDGTWSYFQVGDVPTVKKIEAVDELLYDSFDQQINIMHVTVGGQRKSTRLDYPEANATFEY